MSTEYPEDFVVSNFHSLEDQLIECLAFIPYIQQNRAVVSPKFVPILMDACSLIDSIFRDSTSGSGRHDLKSYAAMHESRLELEPATTLLLVSPLQFLRPFQGWTQAAPDWWQAYNKVKHDRIRNYDAASFTCVVNAMAGLHQVIARSWSFLGNLTRAGWFNESSDGFAELLASRAACAGPPYLPVQTKLFVSAIRGEFVEWNGNNAPQIDNWDFTTRVLNHIGEWEGW